MGATGICWDNAGSESLWSTFKHEYYYRHNFAFASELITAVDNWMHFYNTRRRYSTIGMLGPHQLRTVTDRTRHGRVTAVHFSGSTSVDCNVRIALAGQRCLLPLQFRRRG